MSSQTLRSCHVVARDCHLRLRLRLRPRLLLPLVLVLLSLLSLPTTWFAVGIHVIFVHLLFVVASFAMTPSPPSFVVRRSSFVVRRSSFVVRRCFVRRCFVRRCFVRRCFVRRSSFVVRRSLPLPLSSSVLFCLLALASPCSQRTAPYVHQ